MPVNALGNIAATQQQDSIRKADEKLRAAIASIVSGERADDVANISVASQLQSQTSGLRQIARNVAQGSTVTQLADGGAEQIQKALTDLQSLASQANSPVLTEENRAQLNEQFQQVVKQIDSLAKGSSFNGKSLLDGSLSGDNALTLDSVLGNGGGSEGNALDVADLSSSSLFNGKSLNILSADNASDAFSTLGDALNRVVNARAGIGAFGQTLEFTAASIETAIINQEAARSELSETDLAAASTQRSLADIQRNASIALAAQGNKLAPALLRLIA